VGTEKGKGNCNEDCKEKGWTYSCGEKEAIPTYEGTLGSAAESHSEEVDTDTDGQRLISNCAGFKHKLDRKLNKLLRTSKNGAQLTEFHDATTR
jgi:hypothetical protein